MTSTARPHHPAARAGLASPQPVPHPARRGAHDVLRCAEPGCSTRRSRSSSSPAAGHHPGQPATADDRAVPGGARPAARRDRGRPAGHGWIPRRHHPRPPGSHRARQHREPRACSRARVVDLFERFWIPLIVLLLVLSLTATSGPWITAGLAVVRGRDRPVGRAGHRAPAARHVRRRRTGAGAGSGSDRALPLRGDGGNATRIRIGK